MNEQETPETDNKFNRVNADDVSAYTIALEMRNFARKLKRERDEAREALRTKRDDSHKALRDAIADNGLLRDEIKALRDALRVRIDEKCQECDPHYHEFSTHYCHSRHYATEREVMK